MGNEDNGDTDCCESFENVPKDLEKKLKDQKKNRNHQNSIVRNLEIRVKPGVKNSRVVK